MTTNGQLANGDPISYKPLSQFKTVDEMDDAIRMFLYRYKYQLAPSAVTVLKTIRNYAVKSVVGVCYAKIDTLARTAGVSRSSVDRAIRILKEVGIIAVHHTQRRRIGGQGHSVYVIQNINDGGGGGGRKATDREILPTVPNNEGQARTSIPTGAEVNEDEGTTFSSSEEEVNENLHGGYGQAADDIPYDAGQMTYRPGRTKSRHASAKATQQAAETKLCETKYSGLNKERNNVHGTAHTKTAGDTWHGTPQPPALFAAAVRPFAALIEPADAWRRVTIAKRQAGVEADICSANVVQAAVQAFKAAVAAYKTNRIRKDAGGYFYGCLRNLFAAERRREVMATAGYDWVAAAMMGG